jgi:hypothetical protein
VVGAVLLPVRSLLAAENAGSRNPDSAVRQLNRVSAVSQPFAEQIELAAQSIPDEIWRAITDAGWRIYVAEHVVDAVPALRGTAPRGWPEGTLWDNTDAVHLPTAKQLVIAEKRRNRKGKIVGCTRVGGVLRHELGHAFDMVSGSDGLFRSALPEFLTAYQADVVRMDADQRRQLAYYLQQNEAGRQETFAEAFGIVLGGGSDTGKQSVFEHCFSTTLGIVRSAVKTDASHP